MQGLQSLVDPVSPSQFISDYWCIRHLLIHRSASSLDMVTKPLTDLAIKDMVRCAEEPVIVMHTTTDGRYKGSPVSKLQAFSFFESGMALYFNLSSSFRNIREWTKALASDLGQIESRCKASLFVTPPGWTTEQHFDPNENFTIQLRGHKRWNVAPNDSVKHPVDRFTCSDQIAPRMSLYYAFNTLTPPKAYCLEEMDPGSMLYVPRGHWHSVESVTESVSLNFCILPETWVSFLMPAIERLLLTNTDLREVATGVAGADGLRRIAFHRLKDILPIASSLIADMRPEQMFPEVSPGTAQLPALHDKIQRNDLATVVCDPQNDGSSKVTITVYNCLGSTPGVTNLGVSQTNFVTSPTSTTIHADENQRTMLNWMLGRRSFNIQMIRSQFNSLPSDEVDNFVLLLIRTQLFTAGAQYSRYREE